MNRFANAVSMFGYLIVVGAVFVSVGADGPALPRYLMVTAPIGTIGLAMNHIAHRLRRNPVPPRRRYSSPRHSPGEFDQAMPNRDN